MQKNGSEIMEFKKGIKDSIPVGMGYFAVSFSLGIIAKNVGLSPIQGFLTSLFINASAGEYAVFLMISTHGTFIQMVIMTLVSNARYFLMSFALSQKIEEKTNLLHRMCIGFDLTDELFGLAINHEGKVNHKYIYGTYLVALPCWALGTALGIVAGNSLPTKNCSKFKCCVIRYVFGYYYSSGKKRSCDWTAHYYKFLIELHL